MSLALYYHPLASFCHKVLIALYENATPFEGVVVDLSNEASAAEVLAHWPVGKIPVLRDVAAARTIPETTIIIEYLAAHYPGPVALIPDLDARLWDRFFDLYISVPMQKIVIDRLRPAGGSDAVGVAEARETLRRAYSVAERQLAAGPWATGAAFTLADCAAAPALFFARVLEPFGDAHPLLAAYFERLAARPSFARVLAEARPFLPFFPYREDLEARWLA